MSRSQVAALRHLTWQIHSRGSWQQLSKSCGWATSKDHAVPPRSKTSKTKETREPHNGNFMTISTSRFWRLSSRLDSKSCIVYLSPERVVLFSRIFTDLQFQLPTSLFLRNWCGGVVHAVNVFGFQSLKPETSHQWWENNIEQQLVGGFNQSKKYVRQIASFPQGSGWNKNIWVATTQITNVRTHRMYACDSGLCLVQKCSAAWKKYSNAVLQSFERVWAEPRFATSNHGGFLGRNSWWFLASDSTKRYMCWVVDHVHIYIQMKCTVMGFTAMMCNRIQCSVV